MCSVLDLMAPPAATEAGASTGAGASAGASAGGLPMPSEEPWDEEQYSGFAVEAFLSNVLGIGGDGGGGAAGKG